MLNRSIDLQFATEDDEPFRLTIASEQLPRLLRHTIGWFSRVTKALELESDKCLARVFYELDTLSALQDGQYNDLLLTIDHCDQHHFLHLVTSQQSWHAYWYCETWNAMRHLARLIGSAYLTCHLEQVEMKSVQSAIGYRLLEIASIKLFMDKGFSDPRLLSHKPFAESKEQMFKEASEIEVKAHQIASLLSDMRYRLTSA